MKLSSSIEAVQRSLDKQLHTEENFDIVKRRVVICGRDAVFYFIDGFIKDTLFEKMMEFFYSLKDAALLTSSKQFLASAIPYCEVDMEDEESTVITQLLSGVLCLFVDGLDQCFLIDSRTYPQRETGEPDKEKVFRGSKDGFVETLVFNTALIRRRIRDPQLCINHYQVGSRSKTDVAVCYLRDKADPKLLQNIKKRLSTTKITALTMNQESLAEVLIQHKWYNPFPKFKYSERADTTAAQIMEGDVVLLIDNSPSAMILPTSIFDIMEEANDYYFPPITGTYLRLTRFLVGFFTLILTPTWLLLLENPGWVPETFSFILLDEAPHIPVLWQLLILELAIDGLKLASLNTPNMLTTSLSMIGGIIVGDFAVKSGWFSAEAMLYMAIVAIANYTQPCYELGYALKFMRLILLIATGLFGIYGYIGGFILDFLILACNKTLAGNSYLYPLIPFRPKELKKKFLRIKIDQEQR